VAIAGKWARAKAGQRTGCRSVVAVAWSWLSGCWQASVADVRQGCRWRGPCWQCSITGSSVGLSSLSIGEAGHEATTAPASSGAVVAIAGKWCQVERGTAHRLPIGVAVAWSGSRGAGNPRLPLAWPVLAVLDHRQFGRAFVLSIGEAGHEGDDGASVERCRVAIAGKWCQGERETAHRLPIGVAVAWSGSRGAGNPRLPLAWPVLAALDHRQFGRAFVLSIGEAGHEATTAPASSGAGWRSPASGARANAGQRTGCRSGLPWPGQALGVQAIRGCRWRGPCWQCSITGSSVGPSFSRSVKPATKRRRRQRRAVPGGDRRQVGQVERETAHRLPIGVAVAWSGYRAACRHRLQTCARVAAGVARAGSARSPAVRSGFRPLDR
jgi:hypothetical protein